MRCSSPAHPTRRTRMLNDLLTVCCCRPPPLAALCVLCAQIARPGARVFELKFPDEPQRNLFFW